MTNLLAQASAAPTGGTLAAYVALAGTALTMATAAFQAWSNRRTKKQRAAEVEKANAETGVIAQGTPLEWRTTDHQALIEERRYLAETRDRADKAEKEARDANMRADECRRDRDNDRELIADLRRDHNALRGSYEALLERIGRCRAGTYCPVADSLTAPDM